MKKIYEEYLHVPEEGKIKEKVFIMRVVVAIVCIVFCLSAMGFSAYAFFSSSITSGSNTIMAATYGVEVVIASSGGTALTAKADSPLLYGDVAAGTYAVSLKASGTAKNGYCKIEIVGSEKTVTLFTQQLPPEAGMSFTLVTNGKASITITPQWGTYSNSDVVVGDKSTQEIKLVTVENKDVTQIPDTPQPENQKDKVEIDVDNLGSSGTLPNNSPDDQDVDETTSDSASDETSNGKIDDGSSETIQDREVIE